MAKGFIKSFNVDKGYGFIKPQDGSEDIFVHIKELRRIGVSTLREGQIVEYDIVEHRGRTAAGNVKLAR